MHPSADSVKDSTHSTLSASATEAFFRGDVEPIPDLKPKALANEVIERNKIEMETMGRNKTKEM
jgi:hypothetical protein